MTDNERVQKIIYGTYKTMNHIRNLGYVSDDHRKKEYVKCCNCKKTIFIDDVVRILSRDTAKLRRYCKECAKNYVGKGIKQHYEY